MDSDMLMGLNSNLGWQKQGYRSHSPTVCNTGSL